MYAEAKNVAFHVKPVSLAVALVSNGVTSTFGTSKQAHATMPILQKRLLLIQCIPKAHV
jgi:hypothetical protein